MTIKDMKAELDRSARSLLACPDYIRPKSMTLESADTEDLLWLLDVRKKEIERIEYILKCRRVND